jgi:hypothetical protein
VEARFSRLDEFKLGLFLMVEIFELGRWDVLAVAVQPSVVEPVNPFQGGEFDVVQGAPRAFAPDQFGLEQPDRRFSRGVVVGLSG